MAQARRNASLFHANPSSPVQRVNGKTDDPWKTGNPNRGLPAPTGRYKNTSGHHDATLAKWRPRKRTQNMTGKRGKKG